MKHLAFAIFFLLGLTASRAATTDVAEISFDSSCQRSASATNASPRWIRGVEQTGGQFNDAQKCWSVAATQPTGQGRLSILIDRELIKEDVALAVAFAPATNADFIIQLLDNEDRAIVLDLFGNVMAVSEEAKTDTFVVPLRQFPSAAKIAIRRVNGDIKMYGAILYPVVLQAETDAQTAEELAKLLGDRLSPENPLFKGVNNLASQRGSTQQWVTPKTVVVPVPSKDPADPTHPRFGDGWQVLPFYTDSNWPSSKGEPSVVGVNEVLLQGRAVRSLASYVTPATIDYDFQLEERAANDGSLDFSIIPAGLLADQAPANMTQLRLVYSNTGEYRSFDRLELLQNVQKANTLTWRKPYPSKAQTNYHVRLVIDSDHRLQVFVNGERQPIPESVRVPYSQFHVQALGWQPTNRWHLRNVVVH